MRATDTLPSPATHPDGFTWPRPPHAPIGLGPFRCGPQSTRPYWLLWAYDRVLGRTLSVHLGRAETITEERLRAKAAALADRANAYVPPWPRQLACPRCGR